MHQTYVSTNLAILCPVLRSSVFLLICLRTMYVHPVFFHLFYESCNTCPCIWQFSISIYVPTVFNVFLQQYIQRCVCISGNVDIFQWNKKWFFSRHVQFDSRFHVVTVNKVAWDRPKINYGFTIIPRLVLKWRWRRSIWFSSKITFFFSSVWAIPD